MAKRRLDSITPIGKFTKLEISSMESHVTNVLISNDFENLLESHSAKYHKHEMSCSFPKQFMDDFIKLPDIIKENVMSHVNAINRSQVPWLFGKCYVFRFGINNDKKPLKNPANGRLVSNWPYYIVNVGKGYRMIFEYRSDIRTIRYICIKKSNTIKKIKLNFPDLDDWENGAKKLILEKSTTNGRILDDEGFATYADCYNSDKTGDA